MDVSFDDLIPEPAQPKAKQPAGDAVGLSFDDLVPVQPAPQQSGYPGTRHAGLAEVIAGLPSSPATRRIGLPEPVQQQGPSGFGDYGRDLVRGTVGLGEGLTGIANILSGGAAGNALQDAGVDFPAIREDITARDTPQRQQVQQQLAQAQGVQGTLQAVLDNPSIVPHAIAESVPPLLAGGLIGRGALAVAPGIGGAAAAGIGEGTIAAGQQAEQTRQATGTLTLGQTGLAVGSGVLTGLLGAAGSRIGRSLGVADIDTQLAGVNGADVAKGLVNRVLAGAGIESLEELSQGAQQQVLTNIATGRDPMEGVGQQAVLGGIVGGAMGGAAGLRRPSVPNTEAPADIDMGQQVDPRIAAARQVVPAAIRDLLGPTPAQPAAPSTPTPFAGSQDVGPLLDNLGVQGEARAKSLDLLRPAETNVEAQRRGVLPIAEQKRLAELIGVKGKEIPAFTRKIGQAMNAEEIIATTQAVQGRLQDVLKQQQAIASGQASDVDKAQFVQDLGDLRQAFGNLMGARAEAGRALAAQRRQVYDVAQARQILDGLGGAMGADELATAIGKAVQAGGIGNAAKIINGKPGLFDYYYRAALLSGPRTHAVNILSNSLTLANEVIERGIAGSIGAAKRSVGLNGQTVFSEPLALLIGTARGIAKAGTAGYNAFKTGDSPMLGGAKAETGMGMRPPQGLAERVAGLPFRALGAEDAFFATLNYEGELRAMARQQAVQESRAKQLPANTSLSQRVDQLLQNPTPAMIEQAGEHARRQTFNQKAGTFAQSVMAAKAKAPWLNLIVPFVRTPANIVKFSLKRTPAAPLFTDVREDLKAGGARQERAIARVIWGSSVLMSAGLLAQAGHITGAGPDDKKERAALMATGWRPYSLKVGDRYVEYNRLDPFASWLSLAADFATKDYQHKDAGDLAASLIGSVTNATINKTFMQGLSNFAEMLSDPARNMEWYSRQTLGTLAQPVTLLSNIAAERDPFSRESNSIFDAIFNRTPGLREQLPARLDAWGQPVPDRAYPGGLFSIASPLAVSPETQDPLIREAGRLGFTPVIPGQDITSNGQKHRLSDTDYHEYRQLVGNLTRRGAQRLIATEQWRQMSDDSKRDALADLSKKSRAAVRLAWLPYLSTGNRQVLDRLRATLNGGHPQ